MSLLVGLALLATGGASAQTSTATQASQTTGFNQTIDIPEENVFAALVLDDSVDIDEIANVDRSLVRSQDVGQDVDLDREDVFLLLALDNAGGLGSSSLFGFGGLGGFDDDFLFGSDLDASQSLRATTGQRVSVDEDDLLLALALDDSTDFEDIADFEVRRDFDRARSIDSDLDRDDALLLLALDNRGLGDFDDFGSRGFGLRDFDDDFDDFDDVDDLDSFGLFGLSTFGGGFDDDFDDIDFLGDVDSSSAVSRTVRQDVDLDEGDVFAALALGNNGFGFTDFEDIADIDRSVTTSVAADRDVDLDRDDVLLSLALD